MSMMYLPVLPMKASLLTGEKELKTEGTEYETYLGSFYFILFYFLNKTHYALPLENTGGRQ